MYARCWYCEGWLSFTVDFVWEERANVGVQEKAFGLGRVEFVESSAKTVVSYRYFGKKNMNTLDILYEANQGAQIEPCK